MFTTYMFLAASRYWPDELALQAAYKRLCRRIVPAESSHVLVVDGKGADVSLVFEGERLVIVPMSGGVQPVLLEQARSYTDVVLYAAYIRGNADDETAALMLAANAAPTLMDCWSVLRKEHPHALLALHADALRRVNRVLDARRAVRTSTLLLLGETEPWVVSTSRSLDAYERLGIHLRQLPLDAVTAHYARTTDDEGAPYYYKYKEGARAIIEPGDADLCASGRMTAALLRLLNEEAADGLAIACFNLLSLGVTACLGVSYINDCTTKVAACEGDLDSAVSLLLLKKLARTKAWMANPGLHPGGLVNFSHCTAPLSIDGGEDCPFALRSHHESGIGASLQVDLPTGRRLTAFRISAKNRTFTAQGGVSEEGAYESACRTQLYVRFDDFDRYIRTALGCHQAIVFEDIVDDVTMLAEMLGLDAEQ